MSNTFTPRGFHHVALFVADFDRTLAFYRDGLGFAVVRSWDHHGSRAIMLDVGAESCLEIFESRDGAGNGGVIGHLAIRVDDVDTAFQTAIDAGGGEKMAPRTISIPSDPPYDVRIAFALGPDGEEIEFFTPL